MKPKKELIRVVKRPTEEIVLDQTGKMPGRGAYVCRSQVCLAKAIKQKQLDRALEHKLEDDVVAQLRTMMENLPPAPSDLPEPEDEPS
jgi:predicted RNA-binding protein YlxR (DUF448 family)